ncbi:MAG: hypothetical protein RL059_974, partial [Bacteroidota bacterium]
SFCSRSSSDEHSATGLATVAVVGMLACTPFCGGQRGSPRRDVRDRLCFSDFVSARRRARYMAVVMSWFRSSICTANMIVAMHSSSLLIPGMTCAVTNMNAHMQVAVANSDTHRASSVTRTGRTRSAQVRRRQRRRHLAELSFRIPVHL